MLSHLRLLDISQFNNSMKSSNLNKQVLFWFTASLELGLMDTLSQLIQISLVHYQQTNL